MTAMWLLGLGVGELLRVISSLYCLQYHPVHSQTEMLSLVIALREGRDSSGVEVTGWATSLSSSFINCTCTHNTHAHSNKLHEHTTYTRKCPRSDGTMHELTHHAHTLDEVACSHLQSNYCPLLLRGEEVGKAKGLESRSHSKIMCWQGIERKIPVG